MNVPTPTGKSNGLKTVALKVDDELHAQLMAVAQLEGITATELIRDAVVNHLRVKQEDGSLAARAQAVLDEIEREAASKREAIAAMFGTTNVAPQGAAKASRARKPGSTSNDPPTRPG